MKPLRMNKNAVYIEVQLDPETETLISLGAIRHDGATFYASKSYTRYDGAELYEEKWRCVAGDELVDREEIGEKFRGFCGDTPILLSYDQPKQAWGILKDFCGPLPDGWPNGIINLADAFTWMFSKKPNAMDAATSCKKYVEIQLHQAALITAFMNRPGIKQPFNR